GSAGSGGGAASQQIAVVGTQPIGRPVQVQCALEFVAARFRNGVDDAARGAADLSRITARLHFDRLVELERHFGAAEIVVEVGDVQTIDIIGVFGDRRTADRDEVCGFAAEYGLTTARARRQQHEVRNVAADRNALRKFFYVDRNPAR